MNVRLQPLDDLRYQITVDGKHAGGITLHSCSGSDFSYGIAVAAAMRRRGIAAAALTRLFQIMRAQGYQCARVTVRCDNAASLRLHQKLGFQETAQTQDIFVLEKQI